MTRDKARFQNGRGETDFSETHGGAERFHAALVE